MPQDAQVIFEFIGLPGSGKSTIFTAAATILKQAGYPVTTMRMLAKTAIEEDRTKIGFLRRREQRVSLYGAMAFGEENPEIFDLLFTNARGDLSTNLWNMEMLSHLYFARWRGLPDHPVFMDEGYLHRGAATFLLTRDSAGYQTYLDLIPRTQIIIHVAAPLELAYARTQGRKMKKRVPAAWLGSSDQEMNDNLKYFGDLVDQGCSDLRRRGATVIDIDASLPVETTSAQLAEAVIEASNRTAGSVS